jgi:hypothetical protein
MTVWNTKMLGSPLFDKWHESLHSKQKLKSENNNRRSALMLNVSIVLQQAFCLDAECEHRSSWKITLLEN